MSLPSELEARPVFLQSAIRNPQSAIRNPQSEPSALAQNSAAAQVVVAPSVSPLVAVSPVSESEPPVAPSVSPFVAVPPVSESEPAVAVPPVSESGPRPAPIPSTVARVMPVDEFFRLLIVEAPAPLLGESLAGHRQIDGYRQNGNQQRKSKRSKFEHRNSLFEFVRSGDCLRRRERVPGRCDPWERRPSLPAGFRQWPTGRNQQAGMGGAPRNSSRRIQ